GHEVFLALLSAIGEVLRLVGARCQQRTQDVRPSGGLVLNAAPADHEHVLNEGPALALSVRIGAATECGPDGIDVAGNDRIAKHGMTVFIHRFRNRAAWYVLLQHPQHLGAPRHSLLDLRPVIADDSACLLDETLA